MGKDGHSQQRVGKPLVQAERHPPRPVQHYLQGRHVTVAAHQRAVEEQCEQVQQQAEAQVENGQGVHLGETGQAATITHALPCFQTFEGMICRSGNRRFQQ
ncbi:hypothetical protein D3C79_879040 [compost metagenome]